MITLEKIVAFAISDHQVLDSLGEALRSDLVLANPFYRAIVTFADDFLTERRKLPQRGDYELWLSTLPQGRREALVEALGRLQTQDITGFDSGHFSEVVIEELKLTAARTAVARLNASPDSVSADMIHTLSESIAGISSGALTGMANLRDVDLWYPAKSLDEPLLPTGFPKLDKTIGGWGEELWIVFADSAVGKTFFLQNAGAHAARKGKNVVHFTLELGLRPQIQRYYRQIAQAARAEFVEEEERVKKDLHRWFRFAQGNLHLIEYPAYSMDAEKLRRVVDRIERMTGPVGMVILDYLDLVAPPKGASVRSSYEDLGKNTHLVRSWCGEFSCPVITASQAVRKPENSKRLTLRDMGDSYQKVRGADGILSLNQTEDEDKIFQARLGILKSRDSGGKGAEILLYVNRDLALMADAHHPNTVELMRRLGHLPSSAPPLVITP